jgi:chemotaxis protein CheD
VLGFLREEDIRVVAHDLYGVHPRKIHFFPRTGSVLVRRLGAAADASEPREREYLQRLQPRGGEIEIFERA